MSNSVVDLSDTRVLIVDDNRANIDLLIKMLEPEGYKFSFATNGKQALNIANVAKPDLILLDVMMPDMDGLECCRRLKSNPETSEIPILFVTAKVETQDVVEGFNAGAVDYLMKPVRRAEVCSRVRTHLRLTALMKQRNDLIASLAQHGKYFQDIFEKMRDPIVTLSDRWVVQSSNLAASELLGLEISALLNNSLLDYFVPTEHKKLEAYMTSIAEDADTPALMQIETKIRGEQVIYCDVNLARITKDSKDFVCLLHDTTAHQLAAQQLQVLANLDELTKIANRRGFNEMFAKEWRKAARSHAPLSLLMLDIDHFKAFNDAMGHVAGDHCLIKVATTLLDCCKRPGDFVARYGGEEFVFLLPDTDHKGAMQFANLIQQDVEQQALAHPDSPVSTYVTFSIGVGTVEPSQSGSAELFIQLVDALLYEAKRSGRNTIIGKPVTASEIA